jgi:DNA-binding XRE family transcriptional regulator
MKFRSTVFAKHGVTLMAVAYATDINYRTLTRIKNNHCQCGIDNAFTIARYLNITVDDLFEVDCKKQGINQKTLKCFHQLTIDD